MATVGTLRYNIDANTVKLAQELLKAEKKTKTTAQKMQQAMQRSFRKISQSAARVGVALTAMGTVALAIATRMTKSSLASADALAKTADKLGLTIGGLAGLQLAAEQTGISVETLNMGLQRMVRRIAEAAVGTGEAKGALKELGLDAKELAKLSPDEQFKRVADAMEKVSTEGHKVRLIMKLFDSEGVALKNTLAGGSAALDKFREQADLLGLSMSRIEARKIEDANDAMLVMKRAMTGIGNSMAIAVSPVLTELATKMTELGGSTGGFRDLALNAFRTTAGGVGKMVDAFRFAGRALEGLKVTALGLVAVWEQAAVFDTKLDEMLAGQSFANLLGTDAGKQAVADAEKARRAAEDALFKTTEAIEAAKAAIIDSAELPSASAEWLKWFDDVQAAANDAAAASIKSKEPIASIAAGLAPIELAMKELGVDTEAAVLSLANGFKKASRTAEESYEATKKVLDILLELGEASGGISLETYERQIKALRETLYEGLDEIEINVKKRISDPIKKDLDRTKVYADQAARNIQDAFSQFLFSPFESGLNGMVKGFLDAIRRMVANTAALKLFDLIKGFGKGGNKNDPGGFIGAGLSSLFPKFASGGFAAAGMPAIVGERGPELFIPSQSGTVIPNHRLTGSSTVVNNYSFEAGADIATIRAEIIPMLERTKDVTKAEIMQMRAEGRG